MIKANELRIGNLLDNGHDIVHVTSISLDIDDEYQPTIGVCKFGEHRNEVIVNEGAFGIEIKPISLTPECLERFGFDKISVHFKKGAFTMIPNYYRDASGNYDGFYMRVHIETKPVSVVIRTVHQLQNLYFAMTGEELNVKL